MSVDLKTQLREFSNAMVEVLPELDPETVMDPVVGRPGPARSRSWRAMTAVAALAVAAFVAVPMLLFQGEPPADTTVPDPVELQPVETSVALVPFVDGAPWAEVAYIPYGDTPETLGIGHLQWPIGRDTSGNWWVSDAPRERIVAFADSGYLQSIPLELSRLVYGPHALYGVWLLNDGTVVAMTTRNEIALISSEGVEVIPQPELVFNTGGPQLLASDGRRIFGDTLGSPIYKRFAVEIVDGVPTVSDVDHFTTPLGNRYVVNYRPTGFDMALPDASTPVEVRVEVTVSGAGESVFTPPHAIGGRDGSVHVLIMGLSGTRHEGDPDAIVGDGPSLGLYVQIGRDGSILRTESIPDPSGTPRLSLDPVTDRPYIAVPDAGGVRIWRLDDAAPTVPGNDGPSQSEADANRDWVPLEVAALPLADRVNRLSEVEADEGTWVISHTRPSIDKYPESLELLFEYGEILLLDGDGGILRAFPMQSATPSWLLVTDHFVYAGRIGDGGWPHSTLVRINRRTTYWEGVIFPFGIDEQDDTSWLPEWPWADVDQQQRFAQVVGFASQGATGTQVTSSVGDVVVDVPGINELMNVIGPLSEFLFMGCQGGEMYSETLDYGVGEDGNLSGIGEGEAMTPETALNGVTSLELSDMERLAERSDQVIFGFVEPDGRITVAISVGRIGQHWAAMGATFCSTEHMR